mmetsp:Transcript_23924/g.43905  ORF Transcript_23924/g.43905 Transcript_23924/m.43905 type:complete len:272 (+) Transcript_23924:67-882(+)
MCAAGANSQLLQARRRQGRLALATVVIVAATALLATWPVFVVDPVPLTQARRPFRQLGRERRVGTHAQPDVLSYLPEDEFTPSVDWRKLGGQQARSTLIAVVAAGAAYVLHLADAFCRSRWSLPLWLPPTAGVCIMYALDGVTTAEHMPKLDLKFLSQLALRTLVAVVGSCSLAVFTGSLFKSLVVRRVVAVASCTAWMLLVPSSNFFPPSAAYGAIYVDHLQSKGPLAHLSYRYAAFPCALGVLIVYFSTHLLAFMATKPLRYLTRKRAA